MEKRIAIGILEGLARFAIEKGMKITVKIDERVPDSNNGRSGAMTLNAYPVDLKLPAAEPEITLLQATKTVLEFMKLCDGTTTWLITPDGEKLSCDWGYVEDGLCELVRYAERRSDD